MIQTAYVIENDIVINIIAVDGSTNLAAFNAELIPDFHPLQIGFKRVDGLWYDLNGAPVPRFDPLSIKADLYKQGRLELLAKSDWTQLPDSPLSPELKQAWADYRQALRDVPQQPGWPETINIPLEPGQIII
jgi:hypothetical protein